MPGERGAVYIIGAGGHARVLADSARRAGFTIAGFVDRVASSQALFDAPILAEPEFLALLASGGGPIQVALGLGENGHRRRIALDYERAGKSRLSFPAIVDPSALLGQGVVVAPGAQILARAVVNTGARVERFAIVNTGAIVEHDALIGTYASVAPGACLGGGVRLGEGAFVGLGACVLQEIAIGAHALLGAGAVAIADLPDAAVAFGVPAEIKRSRKPWEPAFG
jgi:sugar O-acyltransferase (sialic acid O-acetyltransferase NeuD family)